MSQDADHHENHARKIAVRVANKDAGGVPVVPEQSKRHTQKGEEEIKREQVGVRSRVRIRRQKVEAIVESEQQGDDDGLGDFDAVDSCQDVDAVGTENGNRGHVDVV